MRKLGSCSTQEALPLCPMGAGERGEVRGRPGAGQGLAESVALGLQPRYLGPEGLEWARLGLPGGRFWAGKTRPGEGRVAVIPGSLHPC